MKTRALIIIVALVFANLFCSASATETGKGKSKDKSLQQADIKVDENNMVIVRYSDTFAENKRKMVVKVFSENNDLIFTRSFRKEGDVVLGFDISQFPEGNYRFELYKKNNLVCSEIINVSQKLPMEDIKSDIIVQVK